MNVISSSICISSGLQQACQAGRLVDPRYCSALLLLLLLLLLLHVIQAPVLQV
jgi:hypothetical protein